MSINSPFPGMDPYLESRWSDVHVTLVVAITEALQPQLPPALRARPEEVVLPPGVDRQVSPLFRGPTFDRFVKIIDVSNDSRTVTVIQVLTPLHKSEGRFNEIYTRKLERYATKEINVVEIDLLRHPPRARLTLLGREPPPQLKAGPYLTCIRRAGPSWRVEIYDIHLGARLPCISIPLRQTDRDIVLDLQPLIDRAYAAGGHDDIDYTRPADPPLEGYDAKWADALLKSAGLRRPF